MNPQIQKRAILRITGYALGTGRHWFHAGTKLSYGVVMTVDDDAIQKLYAEKSVADYIPEEVTVMTITNDPVPATCYNLPAELLSGTNEAMPDHCSDLLKGRVPGSIIWRRLKK